jgi:hypothetical protein
MRALLIGVRLTGWHSLILALSLCPFGAIAYLSMSHSIMTTVNEELDQHLQAVRDIIEDNATAGVPALQDEFGEFANSLGAGARLRVTYHGESIMYASPGLQREVEPASAPAASRRFRAVIGGMRFRLVRQTILVRGDTSVRSLCRSGVCRRGGPPLEPRRLLGGEL